MSLLGRRFDCSPCSAGSCVGIHCLSANGLTKGTGLYPFIIRLMVDIEGDIGHEYGGAWRPTLDEGFLG